MIKYDFRTYLNTKNYTDYQNKVELIKDKLLTDSMNGWYHVDNCISDDELNKVIEISNNIRNNYDVLIVIGIGGSYLGAKAVISAFAPYFGISKPEIIFAGISLSASYLKELVTYIEDKNVIINVISKSGNTLEPNITFEYLYEYLSNKYQGEELRKRIIITTDEEEGILRDLVNTNKYESFSIPRNIGGRFSVLTAAGLLPIAVSGIDVKELLLGAQNTNESYAYQYAIVRDRLYNDQKLIESFTVYEPKLDNFTEWLKQLFAETQGKDNKAIMPISAVNTRDLHSLGQYYQQGSRVLFETVIGINKTVDLMINRYNKSLDEINIIALESVAKAHFQDGTYSNIITLDELSVINFGELIYFFELSAAIGAYLLEVNPFDQPGVTKYKELINESLEVKND